MKTANKFLGSYKLYFGVFLLFGQAFKKLLIGSILLLKSINLRSNFLKLSLLDLQISLSNLKFALCLCKGFFLGLNDLFDFGVLVHGTHPHTDRSSGSGFFGDKIRSNLFVIDVFL